MTTFTDTLADDVGLHETTRLVVTGALTDDVGHIEYIDTLNVFTRSLSNTVALASTFSSAWGALLRDTCLITHSELVNGVSHLALSDGTALGGVVAVGQTAKVADTVALAPSIAVQQALLILDKLKLGEVILGSALYHMSASDTVALTTSLANFFNMTLTDTVALASALSGSAIMLGSLSNTVALAPTLTPQFLLRVTLTDTLDLTASQVVKGIYSGMLADGIELTAAYVEPNGGFTTWVINTRTAAVTEYDNFAFNSFAQMGNRYVGASSTGLYWLDGDDDAGTDIIARLKGGLLQFGGTHLSRLKAAYIATRGEAEFVLRIETGDGVIYDYAVSTRSVRSTKVHMGKGQRARYFSFELTSAGDDFDLESLEFVPIVVERRV